MHGHKFIKITRKSCTGFVWKIINCKLLKSYGRVCGSCSCCPTYAVPCQTKRVPVPFLGLRNIRIQNFETQFVAFFSYNVFCSPNRKKEGSLPCVRSCELWRSSCTGLPNSMKKSATNKKYGPHRIYCTFFSFKESQCKIVEKKISG
jgi:hypothetical protein